MDTHTITMEGIITMVDITVMDATTTVDIDIEGDTTTITDTATTTAGAIGLSLDDTDTIEMPVNTEGIPTGRPATIINITKTLI